MQGQEPFALQGPAVELVDLTAWLTRKYKTGKPMVPQAQIPKAIRNRGVAFETEDRVLDDLRRSGATEELISAIREVRPWTPPKPKQPPAPPKPTTGVLTIGCVPAECMVQVGTLPREETRAGISRKELPAGSYTITVGRDGYETEQHRVDVTANAATGRDFKLKPRPDTMARIGTALIERMLDANPEGATDVLARGTWMRTTAGKIPEERTFAARIGPKETVLVVSSQAGWYQLVCQGETCQARKDNLKEFAAIRQGKELKGDDASRAEQELRFFRRLFLPSVIRDVRSAVGSMRVRATAESDSVGADGHYHVALEGNDEKYLVEIDRQNLLAEVSYTLGTASYSDYAEVGGAKYPKLTQVRAAGEKDGFIRVRLETIAPFTR